MTRHHAGATCRRTPSLRLRPLCTRAQLFFHGKELRPDLYDSRTLEQMEMHTGFSVTGYDLARHRHRCCHSCAPGSTQLLLPR